MCNFRAISVQFCCGSIDVLQIACDCRYAGEYKFAGGTVDEGEIVAEAGARELAEEFLEPVGVALPADAKIRPFVVKQTMPVRSKSNLMFNFVALASENPWLETLDIPSVNDALVTITSNPENIRSHFLC